MVAASSSNRLPQQTIAERFSALALNGSQGRQNLSLLYTQLRTFSWPSLTSVPDPERKWLPLDSFSQ